MKVINCQVHSITPLTTHVYKVLLKPEQAIDFMPGQYLNFVMSDDDKRPFSIASSPSAAFIELQIGAFGDNSYPMQVIERIKSTDTVVIEIPLGNAQLRTESERPLLLMAGGTGLSYIKSMFEYLAEQKCNRPVMVYWGLREPSACYELAETAAIIAKLPHAHFIPVVQTPDEQWQGRTGLVHQAVMHDIISLAPYDIYLAGGFEMVGLVRSDFVEHGALVEHMYADAFAFI
jgi:aquacobalamin reductase/NAD(P)H-flavin reductase